MFERNFSVEHRTHISDSLKGRKLSEQTKKKISDANKGQKFRTTKGKND